MNTDPTEDEQYRRTLDAINAKPEEDVPSRVPSQKPDTSLFWSEPDDADEYGEGADWDYSGEPDAWEGTSEGTRLQGTRQDTEGTREAEIHYLPSSGQDTPEGHAVTQPGGHAEPLTREGVPCPTSEGVKFPDDESGWHFRSAGNFLFSVQDVVPLWGNKDVPLWQKGESLMFVGPPGVGKSTLAHHIILAGLRGDESVLGHPVSPIPGKVLYLAMDRPQQIARAFRRLVRTEEDRKLVEERIIFHAGPLPRSLEKGELLLAKMAHHYGVGLIVVDSMKDIMADASDGKSATAYNTVRQKCLADGVEWIELHHNRKANGENSEPRKLDDVYGNRFLTAGAGSIFSLWGESGAERLHLTHIRQPGNGLRPTWVRLDKPTGMMTPEDQEPELEDLLRTPGGVTAQEVAARLYGDPGKHRAARNLLERTPYALKTPVDREGKSVNVYRWHQPELGAE